MDTMEQKVEQKKQEIEQGCQSGVCQTENDVHKADAHEERKGSRPAYVPAVDLIEGENEVFLIADVPGVPEGGVDITVEKNIMTVVATPADSAIAGKKLAYSEYGVGEYRCSFALSEEINKDGISASLKNGVLRVTLPKSAPVMKKISVATA